MQSTFDQQFGPWIETHRRYPPGFDPLRYYAMQVQAEYDGIPIVRFATFEDSEVFV
jgi:hypothetical protein